MKYRAYYRKRYLTQSSKHRKLFVLRSGFIKSQLPNGTPLNQESVRRKVYFASLAKGLSSNQIEFIWQSASQQYSTFKIREFFLPIIESAEHIGEITYDMFLSSRVDAGIWENHSQAMQVLAYLSREKDQKSIMFYFEHLRTAPSIPWSEFTFILLQKLNEDGLLDSGLCCNLLERDLGL